MSFFNLPDHPWESIKQFLSPTRRIPDYKSRFYAHRIDLIKSFVKAAPAPVKARAEALIAELGTPLHTRDVIRAWNSRGDVQTRMRTILDELLAPIKPSRQGTFNTSFTKASERDGEVFIAFFETMKEQFQRRSYTSVFQQFIKAVDAPHSYQQALDQFKASNSGSGADLPSGGALRVAMQLADAMDQGMQNAPADSKKLVRISYVISRDPSDANDNSMDFGRTPSVVTALDLPPKSTLHAVISVLKKEELLRFETQRDLQIYTKETGLFPSHPQYICNGISWEKLSFDAHLDDVGITLSNDGMVNTMTKVLHIVNKMTRYSIIVLTGMGSEIGKLLDIPRSGLAIPVDFLQKEYPNQRLKYYLFRENNLHDDPQPGFFTKNSCDVRVYPVP